MPPVSVITGLPGPAGCEGVGEETGGLPLLPSPPQADEKIAAVIANTPNQRAEFVRLMKVEIKDMSDDSQDMIFVIANNLLLACLTVGRMLA
jgi:hypothetical protein